MNDVGIKLFAAMYSAIIHQNKGFVCDRDCPIHEECDQFPEDCGCAEVVFKCLGGTEKDA